MSALFAQPTLRAGRVVFVSEDDLWSAPVEGGEAHRLTAGIGVFRTPRLSHDGAQLAACAFEEGARELVLLDAEGGPLSRRTWLGAPDLRVVGFTLDDREVLLATAAELPHGQEPWLRAVPVAGGLPRLLPLGPGTHLAQGGPGRVLCRHTFDLAHWKRYRGGRAGQLWVDTGAGFQPLTAALGNVAAPAWWGERLVFVSDRDGEANLWSCAPDGADLRQHTRHTGFGVRGPAVDGGTVVYACGGALWRLELDGGEPAPIPLRTRSQRTWTQRRYPPPARYIERAALHPDGHLLALTVRGQPFVGGPWEGPLTRVGPQDGARRRLVSWLDAQRLVWASDAGGVDHLEVHTLDAPDAADRTQAVPAPVGRVDALIPAPTGDRVALIGPHAQLRVLELGTGQQIELARGRGGAPSGVVWSPDGAWLAWSEPLSPSRAAIRLVRLDGLQPGPITAVTDGRHRDRAPDFDPLGRYLYFLSDRELDPVRDGVFFGYAFPRGSRPYLVTLQADLPDPFQPGPRPLGKPKPLKPPPAIAIDLDGIATRIVRFDVAESRYQAVVGLPSGRVLLQRRPVRGALGTRWGMQSAPEPHDELWLWDGEAGEISPVLSRITGFSLDRARKTAVVRAGWKLRVLPADPDKGARAELKRADGRPGRKTGWFDPGRIRLTIDPPTEWRQMFDEAWRLMRDHFWEPGLAGVDWEAVRARYLPLVERVGTRAELTDLLWCMQGELGTSHAYEVGGDHRVSPAQAIGRLAADLVWEDGAWVVGALAAAEPGDADRCSPLAAAGVGATPGTRIHAIDGQPVREDLPVGAMLVGAADRPVQVQLAAPGGPRRALTVRPLADDTAARLRAWVAERRAQVQAATDGRAGYLHIPDMGPQGFADFHRDFLAASECEGLIVDVRYNRGGHVSPLLIARLVQRRLGQTTTRSHGAYPWPTHAPGGALVALINAYTGSDGDLFAHQWRALGLGPLVGTRTWGGVIGIAPRRPLVDRAMTTQPEFATVFDEVQLENQGVAPDIEVLSPPGAAGDPPLERAIALVIERLG